MPKTRYFFTIVDSAGKPVFGPFQTYEYWFEAADWLGRWGKPGEKVGMFEEEVYDERDTGIEDETGPFSRGA